MKWGQDVEDPGDVLRCSAIFTFEVLVLAYFRLSAFRFYGFMLGDQGANLTVQYLTGLGYRPGVDFGYLYSTLPLLIGRLWFGIFGLTPGACGAAMVTCGVLLAWSLARFATALRVGPVGVAFLVVTLPHALIVILPNLTHTIEAALLGLALAEQASGRRTRALALATACCFVKPSMAYPYGLLLLIMIAWSARVRGDGKVRWAATLGPSVLTGLVLFAVLASVYGSWAVVQTLLPLTGMRVYRQFHFGFFRGHGRNFWLPPGARPGYYLGTPAGFWLAGTLSLIGASFVALRRLVRPSPEDDRALSSSYEMVLTCCLLHVAFVTLFFGNAWSWAYYSYMLVMGLTAMVRLGRRWAILVGCLAALALVGLKGEIQEQWRRHASFVRSKETAWIAERPEVRQEWVKVLELTRGRHPVLLHDENCAGLLFPQFAKPVSVYFCHGMTLPEDVRRQVDQLASASMVVLPTVNGSGQRDERGVLVDWPEFGAAMKRFDLVWRGTYFLVYARRETPARR